MRGHTHEGDMHAEETYTWSEIHMEDIHMTEICGGDIYPENPI